MTAPLTEPELRSLLSREEGQYLEFKSLWDQTPGNRKPLDRRGVRNVIAEYVAAFANADGGALKNADYRQIFGLTSRSATSRELARLVKQGYLNAEGERRGAKYRPGARLTERVGK